MLWRFLSPLYFLWTEELLEKIRPEDLKSVILPNQFIQWKFSSIGEVRRILLSSRHYFDPIMLSRIRKLDFLRDLSIGGLLVTVQVWVADNWERAFILLGGSVSKGRGNNLKFKRKPPSADCCCSKKSCHSRATDEYHCFLEPGMRKGIEFNLKPQKTSIEAN